MAENQVRAKFQVQAVRRAVQGDGSFGQCEVEMAPVYGPAGSVNATWARYTPSGSIKLHITAEGAAEVFRPGQLYFVDFILTDSEDR